MRCLISGDAVVHLPEFLLDECQTSVNESCAAASHLVLLVYPVLVECVNDGGQYPLGLFGGVIGVLDVENGGFLVVSRDNQTIANALCQADNFTGIIVEAQVTYYFGQQVERVKLTLDIGDADRILHQGHVVELPAVGLLDSHVARGLFLDHDGCLTGEEVGRGEEIIEGQRHDDRERDDEPTQMTETERPELLYGDKIVGMLVVRRGVAHREWVIG